MSWSASKHSFFARVLVHYLKILPHIFSKIASPESYKVGESRILRAGQGLFAKCDIEEGTVISFYNGVRFVGFDGMLRCILVNSFDHCNDKI